MWNTASMTARSITILSQLKMSSFGPCEGVLSINCAINCTLLKVMPNVQQFLNFVVHALLDKAVSNK